MNRPAAEKRFLRRLAALLLAEARPVLVTDAGFRTPWFRAVAAMDWDWVGRLRGTTLVKPVEVEDRNEEWVPCSALHRLSGATPREMPLMHIDRSRSLACRTVLYRKTARGRKHTTCHGHIAWSKLSRQCARREREPWLVVASPERAHLSPRQLVTLYSRHMQIKASFRDLKSHRYGLAFEDSLTRKGADWRSCC